MKKLRPIEKFVGMGIIAQHNIIKRYKK